MKKSTLSNLKNKKIVAFALAFAMIVTAGIFMIPEALKVEASGDTVADGMLDVKMQVQDVGDTLNMRLVSSVNGLGYSKVGFEVIFDSDRDGDLSDEEKIVHTAYSVLEHINASKTGVTYDYSPKVIDENAEYFITGTLMGILEDYRDHVFYVRAYATSLDGSVTTYGAGRYFTIDDADNNAIINIPVKMDSLPDGVTVGTADALSVTVGDTSTTATVLALRDGYAQLNIKVADKTALNSASLVTANGVKTIYRNLESSKAVVGADDSWYTVYHELDPNQKNFVIVTDADLYGLGTKSQSHTFEGEEIYVVADIAANTGDASTWSATNQPTNMWTPIGNGSILFKGNFDGCGHSISGIYVLETAAPYKGMFATVNGGTIRNFKLLNSYFESTLTSDNILGAIAGYMNGTLENVYSDAIVKGAGYSVGGLVGYAFQEGNLTIKNCQNHGSVTSTNAWVGGFVGRSRGAGVTIEHCLNAASVTTTSSQAGGFVGAFSDIISGQTPELVITDSLSTGKITASGGHCTALVARFDRTEGSKLSITNTYTTDCSANLKVSVVGGSPTNYTWVEEQKAYSEAKLQGIGGGIYTDLDFENYWAAVKGKTPELKTWTTGTEVAVNDEMRLDDSWTETNTITTVGQLYDFAEKSQTNNYSGQTISLGKDITVNAGLESEWDGTEYKWQPIGSGSALFAGTFDGNGHTISGIYGYTTTDMNLGLFRYLQGTVKNLRLENSYFYSSAMGSASDGGDSRASEVGAIVGATRNGAVIQNVYTNATVYATSNRAAGFVGGNRGTLTIENCWNAGNITVAGENKQHAAGFIASSAYDAQPIIKNCLNTGKIKAVSAAGAFVSFAWGNGNAIQITIENCLSAGTVEIESGRRYGAYIGMLYSGATANITNSYVLDDACVKQETSSGAIIGYTNSTKLNGTDFNLQDSEQVYANSNTNTGVTEYAKEKIFGIGGRIYTSLDFGTCWSAIEGKTPELTTLTTGTKLTVDDSMKLNTSWYDGSQNYTIDTVGELYGLAELSQTNNFAGETIKLGKNITVNAGNASEWGTNAYNWLPIGTTSTPFAGIFDGDGYTISGLYCYATSQYAGLFSKMTGTVKNLKLLNSKFQSTAGNIGAIAGWASGTIENIYSNATVTSDAIGAGGIVGYNDGTLAIMNCWNAGNVTVDNQRVGGFIGGCWQGANTTIIHCLNSGDVTAQYHLGGFVGQMFGNNVANSCKVSIEDSVNLGTITATTGTKRNAAFVGLMNGQSNLTISDAYAVSGCAEYGAIGYVNGAWLNETEIASEKYPIFYSNTAEATNVIAGTYEVAETNLLTDAQGATPNLDWTTPYWVVGTDGLPALKQIEWK